jgi:hypothetical protein
MYVRDMRGYVVRAAHQTGRIDQDAKSIVEANVQLSVFAPEYGMGVVQSIGDAGPTPASGCS